MKAKKRRNTQIRSGAPPQATFRVGAGGGGRGGALRGVLGLRPGAARRVSVRRQQPALSSGGLQSIVEVVDRRRRSRTAAVQLLAERPDRTRRSVLLSRSQCAHPRGGRRAGFFDRAEAARMVEGRGGLTESAGRIRGRSVPAAPVADRSRGLHRRALRSAQRDVLPGRLHGLPVPPAARRPLGRNGRRAAAVHGGAAFQRAGHRASRRAAADRLLVESRLFLLRDPPQLEIVRAGDRCARWPEWRLSGK